jgi:hypothetical protein
MGYLDFYSSLPSEVLLKKRRTPLSGVPTATLPGLGLKDASVSVYKETLESRWGRIF